MVHGHMREPTDARVRIPSWHVPIGMFDEWRSVSAYYMRQTDRGRVRQNLWPGGFFV